MSIAHAYSFYTPIHMFKWKSNSSPENISKKMKLISTSLLFFIFLFSCGTNADEKTVALESEKSLEQLIAAAGDKKLVLLGEASHGTHEYYVWRDKISRQLIANHQFNFIAVESACIAAFHDSMATRRA